MDFTTPPHISDLADKTRAFVYDKIIPFEKDPRWDGHGPSDEMRDEMNALAKAEGLFMPHGPKEYGGMGLNMVERAFILEASGYSMLGPVAMHCAAPDEGNTHLLDVAASPMQREKYLKPLVQGGRSCFAMTEPDGAGSDPMLLSTTAELTKDGYVINGKKWFITGAHGAAFMIIMAKIKGGDHDGEATMFLSELPRDGIKIVKDQNTMDSSFCGAHSVIEFNNLVLQEKDILGAPGKGFDYAQIRLAPARLTHCMRWLGSAQRALDIAADYAGKRMAFGKTLGQHEGVSFMLADSDMEIRSSRLSMLQACWVLDNGGRGTTESSMAKVQCSETVWNTVDRAVQVLGGKGMTDDTIVARIFQDVRAFRIYDGPSEVHRWSLGRKVIKSVKQRNEEVK
ncbi:MAG: acyl-CoA dehydrogenase family protein [Rhodobacteraceae bacterium]|nr:acyl-CoA dehydrogenase family protein [Paracoccaceae bacterium]